MVLGPPMITNRMLKLRNIFILLAILLGAGVAHAQTIGGTDPVQYIVAPEAPGPHAPVTITVQGVGTFLGNANVTWNLNGAAQSGVGMDTFSFTTGGIGSQSIVRVTIDSATQGVISHTFTFNPSSVNLVWEADTSVPPLYQGKALYSAGSALRVIAFPTVVVGGTRVAAESLSYQWSVNDTPVPSASGTGKSTLSYTGDQLKTSEDIAVDVYLGTTKVGHGEVIIPAAPPALVLYNKDPLRGVLWEQALPQRIALNQNEFTVVAEPYFFSNAGFRANTLSFNWVLNGSPVSGPTSDQGILTLRQTGTTKGQATLSVSLQDQDSSRLMQNAQTALTLLFGQTESGIASFFGL